MRLTLTFFLITLAGVCLAGDARKALDELLAYSESLFNSRRPCHVQYDMIITGRSSESSPQSITVDYYKGKAGRRMVMGNKKEITYKDGLVLSANHVMKRIIIAADTSSANARQGTALIGQLSGLMDSAVVTEDDCSGSRCFTIQLKDHAQYATVKLWFENGDTPLLQKIEAGFLPGMQRYKNVVINYTTWDTAWSAPAGFFDFNKYVSVEGQHFNILKRWKNYQFYQPSKLTEK